MTDIDMKKWSSVYFLILSIPATLAGLLPIWMSISVLHDATSDSRIQRHLNVPLLEFASVSLFVLILAGLTNLPGYLRQIREPRWNSQSFWMRSAIYNLIALIAFVSWLVAMGRPFVVDASIIIFIGILIGLPLFGVVLSLSCRSSNSQIAYDS